MSWTDAKPTQPGWYWFTGWQCTDDDERDDIELTILHVVSERSTDGYYGKWLGPLPQPEAL